MKALKIIKCSDRLMWYRDHVGKTVSWIGTDTKDYLSREPAGYLNIVKKTDAEIVDVPEAEVLYLTQYDRRM